MGSFHREVGRSMMSTWWAPAPSRRSHSAQRRARPLSLSPRPTDRRWVRKWPSGAGGDPQRRAADRVGPDAGRRPRGCVRASAAGLGEARPGADRCWVGPKHDRGIHGVVFRPGHRRHQANTGSDRAGAVTEGLATGRLSSPSSTPPAFAALGSPLPRRVTVQTRGEGNRRLLNAVVHAGGERSTGAPRNSSPGVHAR